MKNFNDLSIIIPTINEKENLQRLLYVLMDMYPEAHIFITDDGSTDGTLEFITTIIKSDFKNPLYFISRNNNRIYTNNINFNTESFYKDKLKLRDSSGLTVSVLDALYIIPTTKFAVIDADFQHPPQIIEKLHSKLHQADLVSAYRTKLKGFPFYRKILTRAGTMLAKSVLPEHSQVKDPLSGAFAGNIKVLKSYFFNIKNFKLEGFKILFDLLKSIPSDINIKETGYEFEMRKQGESKINLKHLWSFFTSIFDKNTKKFFAGILLLLLIVTISSALIFIYGDINLTSHLRAFAKENQPFLMVSKFITDYGNPFYYLIFIFLIITGIIKKKKKLWKIGLIYIIVQIVASLIITGGLKILVGRPRPGRGFQHQFLTSRSTFKSFPSGHTTDAFSSAGILWGFLKGYPLSVVSFLFSLAIGLSRVFVGSHYFLDVVAGMSIGFLTGIIITKKFF